MPSSPVSPLAIDYVVDGPRTAAAVAAGEARLLGMTYQAAGQQPRFVAEDLAAVLSSFGDRPRVYPDSLLRSPWKCARTCPCQAFSRIRTSC